MGDVSGAQTFASLKNAILSELDPDFDTAWGRAPEPIAIIGIGCRFPGAGGPEAFWQLVRDGVNAIGEIPAERFDIDAVYDVRPGIPGKLNTRYGGFLEKVDHFDPSFFGISPREAAAMDPQQRLLLEVAWEAMEDAGQTAGTLDPGRTGVFVGMCNSDYEHLLEDPADIDIYIAGGIAKSVLSGRLSYALGLEGPSLTLDTACSTSLVAVHLACQSLWTGESTLALAGGVNIILLPHPYMGFCRANMLAPDGQCKFGDARADGFVRSEGAGIVVLKRLSQALADHDDVYAVIRGSAVSNDGRSGGLLMTPSVPGQQQAFRNAYRRAGISPGQVQYVECHGTGTNVGDPVELQALANVVAEGRPPDRPLAIGSVKTNIGHTEAAAGVAGLIKVALALKHKMIPPSLHFLEPNPAIPWDRLPLVVQQELLPWPADGGPALAGVSSFGISGTNAHVVLQEAPPPAAESALESAAESTDGSPLSSEFSAVRSDAPALHLLPLSARSPEALKALARAYQEFVTAGEEPALPDICYTASMRRTHHDHRLAVVARSKEELAGRLAAFMQDEPGAGFASGRRIAGRRRKVVFVFSGQGSQWLGMGRELWQQEPVYRQALARCDQVMRQIVDWSLLEELAADEAHSRLDQVDVIQPAIFAVQVALAELWRSWGIEPDAVIGQSMGEVAAATAAGALSLDDAARIICRRSQLAKETSGHGRMVVVSLTLDEARRLCATSDDAVSVAVSMSPSSTVLSGEAGALEAVVKKLESQDVFCRWIKVDYASHSPQVEPLIPELLHILEGIQPLPPSVPIYSTVTGARSDGLAFDAAYWARNLREPVLFSTALQQLLDDDHEIFIEVSPHPLLLSAIRQWLQALDREGMVLPSLQSNEGRATMLGSLGALFTAGAPIAWDRLLPVGGKQVRLPPYPWQRERYWLDFGPESTLSPRRENSANGRSGAIRGSGKGHLLGQHLKSAAASGTHYWEIDLGTRLFPYLADHRVQGLVVLPAAAYVEIALAAASEAFGAGTYALENIAFKKALFVPERGYQRVQLIVAPQLVGDSSFELYSLQTGAADGQASWMLHARGTIRPIRGNHRAHVLSPRSKASPDSTSRVLEGSSQREEGSPTVTEPVPASPAALLERCPESVAGADFYQVMAGRGLQYGPSFQGVERLWRGDGEAVGQLRLPDSVLAEAGAYQVHPALLDACFQVLAGALPGSNLVADGQVVKEGVYLPVGLGKIRLYDQRPSPQLWVHALFRPDEETDGETLAGDVFLIDDEGHIVLEALGFQIQRVERDVQVNAEADLDDWLYTVRWEAQTRPEYPERQSKSLPRAERGGEGTLPEEEQAPAEAPGSWVIFAPESSSPESSKDNRGVAGTLQALLEARGETCFMVVPGETFDTPEPGHYTLSPANKDDFQQLFADVLGPHRPPCRGLIHLWSLNSVAPDAKPTSLASLEATHVLGSFSVLHIVQSLAKAGPAAAPRLWLVTAGSQVVDETSFDETSFDHSDGAVAPVATSSSSISQAPVWGLGKVIAFEHPELRCKKVDLSPAAGPEEIQSLFEELWSENQEDQVVLRGDGRYVPRLVRYSAEDADIRIEIAPDEQAFRLEIPTPGILDSFRLRVTPRRRPGPGEVEIQVKAVGLNFRDVMIAMDLLPPLFEGSLDVGFECAGVIVAVGEAVEGLQVGDHVVAGAPACFGSYVTTADFMVALKPDHLTFDEAATIPIAFLTAYYALNYLGRICQGDRVLIHAASGGVGQAAVQIAQHIGAEIFATAGSPEKRAFLRAQGIEHVMDSRSLDFAGEVMDITNGEGVDLVLNSLAGEFIPRGISVLRAGGRFLEIGKVDILQNTQLGLQLLDNNIAFFAIDLSKLILNEPALIRALWQEAVSYFSNFSFRPLPLKVFPVADVVEAFRYMAQAKHIGKVVVSLETDKVLVVPARQPVTFADAGTYLISGGAGGLGLAVAQWLVDQGARHLVLMGRSGATPAAQPALDAMAAAGAEVRVVKADVAQVEQVAQVLAEIRESMPPLRGVIHAAGVLDDGILLQLTPERFRKVMAPKIDGAWNLHQLTLDDPLDHFVLFSSGASVLGSPGQGNYVAANAFLDALAHQRRALGLPATAINWGAWAEVGLATRADRVQHLSQQGIIPFTPQQGVELMGRILASQQVQMLAVSMDWARLTGLFAPPFLSYLADEAAREAGPSPTHKEAGLIRAELLSVTPRERPRVAERFLREQIARVLRASPDKIDVHQPLTSLGIDSLMAVELKNRVETEMGIALPVTALLQGPTLAQLATVLLEQLTDQAPEPEAATASPTPLLAELASPAGQEGEAALLAKLDELSDEEVDKLLQEMIEAEDGEIEQVIEGIDETSFVHE